MIKKKKRKSSDLLTDGQRLQLFNKFTHFAQKIMFISSVHLINIKKIIVYCFKFTVLIVVEIFKSNLVVKFLVAQVEDQRITGVIRV